MAEERTLGLARAEDYSTEEPSKEELQRRLEEARDSISSTVTEIKETVSNQVQAVKDTLDWREQFKKRPIAWSASAAGVGFCLGYCIAAYAKGDERDHYSTANDRYLQEEPKYYASQPILGSAAAAPQTPQASMRATPENGKDSGPGLFEKVTSSQAFGRVKDEAGSLGDAVMKELSNTARTLVIPALITSLRNFIGDYLPNAKTEGASAQKNQSRPGSSYQPSLERNPS